jgi:hypothetical protein
MHGPTQQRVLLDESEAALLAAFADTLIPGGGAFPPPSAIRIVEDFMTRYIAEDGTSPLYLPGVTRSDVAALADAVGTGFAEADAEARTSAVADLEREQPELFARLRALVYAGYYSRPEVRTAIANALEAGRDLRRAPQPYGYLDVIEPWDESLLSKVGSYVKTEEVRPIDRDRLAKLVAKQAAKREEASA